MLEINDLKKTFENGSPALKGVNLKINKGEFVSILGPSGSGKTTLLRTINGLETSSGGEIYFNNIKVNMKINHRLFNRLFKGNEEKSIKIKNFWEDRFLVSQNRFCSYEEKFLYL